MRPRSDQLIAGRGTLLKSWSELRLRGRPVATALVESGDQLRERSDVALVPAGQPLAQAIPDALRRQHGADASVVIVVGRSEHGYHQVLGSVPKALAQHVHYPVLVIP